MGTRTTRFFNFRFFENRRQKFGTHFRRCDGVDLLKFTDIAKLEVVKRKAIEAIATSIDVHRAAIRTTEVQIVFVPFFHRWRLFDPMEIKTLDQMRLIFSNFIKKTGRERTVETEIHLRVFFKNIQHLSTDLRIMSNR